MDFKFLASHTFDLLKKEKPHFVIKKVFNFLKLYHKYELIVKTKNSTLKNFPFLYKKINYPFKNVYLELTNNCNLRCTYCYTQNPRLFNKRNSGFMEFSLFKDIVDQLSELDYRIVISLNLFGESTLHPKFIDFLEYAHSKKNLDILLNTNGVITNQNKLDALLFYKIKDLVISLDGLDDHNEKIREKSNTDLIKKNILSLLEKRKSMSPSTSIKINATDIGQEKESFVNYWIDKVDGIFYTACISEDAKIINKGFFEESLTIENKYCKWPFNTLIVLWNGDLTTCCRDFNGVNVFGSAKKTDILSLWNGEGFKKIRLETIKNKTPQFKLCSNCEYYKTEFKFTGKNKNNRKIIYREIFKEYIKS